MIWIPSGGFHISQTEITNQQFKKFVDATGYKTVAERKPSWNDLKEDLPEGTPAIPDSLLVAGSLVFVRPTIAVTLNDYSRWWRYVDGADWRHPEGPGSDLTNRWDHPVIHIAYEDALAYCDWDRSRLPTEAEWELASGDATRSTPEGKLITNTYQGVFPVHDLKEDGFDGTSPVKSYPPNEYGLYDMIGNVWEWTTDVYKGDYFASQGEMRVTKGGSFLCAENYCSNYYSTARQGSSVDTGTSNIGFRVVRD